MMLCSTHLQSFSTSNLDVTLKSGCCLLMPLRSVLMICFSFYLFSNLSQHNVLLPSSCSLLSVRPPCVPLALDPPAMQPTGGEEKPSCILVRIPWGCDVMFFLGSSHILGFSLLFGVPRVCPRCWNCIFWLTLGYGPQTTIQTEHFLMLHKPHRSFKRSHMWTVGLWLVVNKVIKSNLPTIYMPKCQANKIEHIVTICAPWIVEGFQGPMDRKVKQLGKYCRNFGFQEFFYLSIRPSPRLSWSRPLLRTWKTPCLLASQKKKR